MDKKVGLPFYAGMILLAFVSICTTYISLNDSILPEPTVTVPLWSELSWECSVLALALSVGIGLMLLALKMAIIDEQKRLSALGLLGLCLLAFISISFNMDVLYRTADKDFFLDYSKSRMTTPYTEFFTEVRATLDERKADFQKKLALQEVELEAEIEGWREAPAGYGPIAKKENYELLKLEKVTKVDLEALVDANAEYKEANAFQASSDPRTIVDLQKYQDELRVLAKDLAAATGIPLPPHVKLESPLFAVLSKLTDLKTFGLTEAIFLILALVLDLGDIVGYTLVPNRKRPVVADQGPSFGPRLMPKPEPPVQELALPDLDGPEIIPDRLGVPEDDDAKEMFFGDEAQSKGLSSAPDEGALPRAFRFRRRR